MSDPRIETVLGVLRETGHNATGSGHTTDDLATMIVNALDREHGTPAGDATDTGDDADAGDAGQAAAGNPETPGGTGTEGGSADAAG